MRLVVDVIDSKQLFNLFFKKKKLKLKYNKYNEIGLIWNEAKKKKIKQIKCDEKEEKTVDRLIA